MHAGVTFDFFVYERCSFKSLPKGLVRWEAGKHSAAVKRLKEAMRCEVFNEIWIVISQILRCSGI
jgi:hypothetical protein